MPLQSLLALLALRHRELASATAAGAGQGGQGGPSADPGQACLLALDLSSFQQSLAAREVLVGISFCDWPLVPGGVFEEDLVATLDVPAGNATLVVDCGHAPNGRLLLCQAPEGGARRGPASARPGCAPAGLTVLCAVDVPSRGPLRHARLCFSVKPGCRLAVNLCPALPSELVECVRASGGGGDVIGPVLSVVPTALKYPPSKPPRLWTFGQVRPVRAQCGRGYML